MHGDPSREVPGKIRGVALPGRLIGLVWGRKAIEKRLVGGKGKLWWGERGGKWAGTGMGAGNGWRSVDGECGHRWAPVTEPASHDPRVQRERGGGKTREGDPEGSRWPPVPWKEGEGGRGREEGDGRASE